MLRQGSWMMGKIQMSKAKIGACFQGACIAIGFAIYFTMPAGAATLSVVKAMDEDAFPRPFELKLYGSDDDGDEIRWTISTPPRNGTASVTERGREVDVQYIPDPDWFGTDEFFVEVADEMSAGSRVRVIVNVEPQNDGPVNAARPTIVGMFRVGQTIYGSQGAWDDRTDDPLVPERNAGGFKYKYQWLRADRIDGPWAPIAGATALEYKISSDDWQKFLALRVTATDFGPWNQKPQSTDQVSEVIRIGDRAPIVSLEPLPDPEPEFPLMSFRFKGNEAVPDEVLEKITGDYTGGMIGISGLTQAAREISGYYLDEADLVVAARIPVQEVTSGEAVIEIQEGRLGEILVAENNVYSDEFVLAHMKEAIKDKDRLRGSQVEAGILRLNRNPGMQSGSVLQPGDEPDEVNVVVVVDEQRRGPIKHILSYNNYGAKTISDDRFSYAMDVVNLTDWALHISARIVTGREPEDLNYWSLNFDGPIGVGGIRYGGSLGAGEYEVTNDFADLGIRGDSFVGTAFINFPWVVSRPVSMEVELGFEFSDTNFDLLGRRVNEDRARAVYFRYFGNFLSSLGASTVDSRITFGLDSLLGGSENTTLTSRRDADNDFTKIQLAVAQLVPMSDTISLYLSANGQASSDSLMSSQEWQAGGVGSVRGFAPGEFSGDSGYRGSVELRWRPDLPDTVIFGFYDFAGVYRRQPLVAQSSEDDLEGAGLGFSYQPSWGDLDASLKVDVSWPIQPNMSSLDQTPVTNAAIVLEY